MKKKVMKLMSFVILGVIAFFGGIGTVSATRTTAVDTSVFLFDYSFKLRINTTLTETSDGTGWQVGVTAYKEYDETKGTYSGDVDLTGDAIYYTLTEIDASTYTELLALQNAVDELGYTPVSTNSTEYTDVVLPFSTALKDYWCYMDVSTGDIILPKDCEDDKYYVVVIEVADDSIQDTSGDPWIYRTGRVFKVEADSTMDSCTTTTTTTTTDEENPSTNVATPYIVGGAVLVGAIAIIVVSKKKKFI